SRLRDCDGGGTWARARPAERRTAAACAGVRPSGGRATPEPTARPQSAPPVGGARAGAQCAVHAAPFPVHCAVACVVPALPGPSPPVAPAPCTVRRAAGAPRQRRGPARRRPAGPRRSAEFHAATAARRQLAPTLLLPARNAAARAPPRGAGARFETPHTRRASS